LRVGLSDRKIASKLNISVPALQGFFLLLWAWELRERKARSPFGSLERIYEESSPKFPKDSASDRAGSATCRQRLWFQWACLSSRLFSAQISGLFVFRQSESPLEFLESPCRLPPIRPRG
jgi:hypothetical protein